MAVKTITIDLEAYELLRRRKGRGDSFSKVIKEHFGAPRKGRDLLAALRDFQLDEDTLQAIETVVAQRGSETPRVPEL